MDEALPAGALGAWLDEVDAALAGTGEADVACGTCTACCRSAQFVHVGPDEHDALAAIPAAVRFPAAGRPEGTELMGYDERGRCPMLGDAGCGIYAHRPRTCRTYDCRVLAAAGVEQAGDVGPAILERVRRWRFDLDAPGDRARLDAVRAAAAHLARHAPAAPTTERAVAAVRVRHLFADGAVPDPDDVRRVLRSG